MNGTTKARSHWFSPGRWPLALAFAIGVVSATLSLISNRLWGTRSLGFPSSWFLFVLVGSAVFAPLEEWIFRGVILRFLLRFGTVGALVISSALFAIVHGFKAEALLGRFALGLVFGALYLWRHSLWPLVVKERHR